MVTRQIKHKQEDGSEVTLDIGALAANVETDESHQFVTQEEKEQRKDRKSIVHTLYAQSFMKNGEKMWKPFWKQMATEIAL